MRRITNFYNIAAEKGNGNFKFTYLYRFLPEGGFFFYIDKKTRRIRIEIKKNQFFYQLKRKYFKY